MLARPFSRYWAWKEGGSNTPYSCDRLQSYLTTNSSSEPEVQAGRSFLAEREINSGAVFCN